MSSARFIPAQVAYLPWRLLLVVLLTRGGALTGPVDRLVADQYDRAIEPGLPQRGGRAGEHHRCHHESHAH